MSMTAKSVYLAMEEAGDDEVFLARSLSDAPLTEDQRTVVDVYLGRVAQRRELAGRRGGRHRWT